MARPLSRLVCAAIAACSIAAAVYAQRGFGLFGPPAQLTIRPNVPYDGRFTFVRVRYNTSPGGYWYRGLPAWAHGYPMAERNLMKIMNELTYLGARDEINTITLDDPQLFQYAIAYIIEVSWWDMTDAEAAALGAYMRKGGFVIVDDFKATGDFGSLGWEPFEADMRKILPGARFFDLQPSDPIFHSFFDIETVNSFPQAYNRGLPVFRGVYEDNDPRKRMMMVVNYNTDISQFWEWSGRGLRPFDQTNEAYKLGVNYLMYGLTH